MIRATISFSNGRYNSFIKFIHRICLTTLSRVLFENINLDDNMQCVLPPSSAKMFLKSLQTLAKMAPSIILQVQSEAGITITAIAPSQSSMAKVAMPSSLFQSLTIPDPFICRINVKAMISAAKNISSLSMMKITVDVANSSCSVDLIQKSGIQRKIKFALDEDAQFLGLDGFSWDDYGAMLVIPASILAQCLISFHQGVLEVTFEIFEQYLRVASLSTIADSKENVLQTEYVLERRDFTVWEIEEDLISSPGHSVRISFGMRELRAIVGFCEAASFPVFIAMDQPGEPIVLANYADAENTATFSAQIVAATLSVGVENAPRTPSKKARSSISEGEFVEGTPQQY